MINLEKFSYVELNTEDNRILSAWPVWQIRLELSTEDNRILSAWSQQVWSIWQMGLKFKCMTFT